MEQSELLRMVVRVLEELGLPYLVTGSTATIFYGEPRFTADIDVVVRLPESRISELVDAFAGDAFYLDEESIRQAVSRRGQFNIIHQWATYSPRSSSVRRRTGRIARSLSRPVVSLISMSLARPRT